MNFFNKHMKLKILSFLTFAGFSPAFAVSTLITLDMGPGTQGANNGPASIAGYNLYNNGSVAANGVITYGTSVGTITTITPTSLNNGSLTVNLTPITAGSTNFAILNSIDIGASATGSSALTITPVAGAAVGSPTGLVPLARTSNTAGAGIGVGTDSPTTNAEIDLTSTLTETLSFNFSQPVLLVAVRGGFWDTGTGSSRYNININGQTFTTADGNGGWYNFTGTGNNAPGFTQTTIDGRTGVLLNPGQTFTFTPAIGASGNTTGSANGHINELSFYAVPEPTTAALGLLGIVGLMRRRRA
jgi:hypothetical protein